MNPTRTPRRALARAAALLALAAAPGAAQSPDTDIFVADLRVRDGEIAIGQPRNITDRPGYDNQPWFLPDGRALLYTSERGGQTDVYRYDLAAGSSEQVTDTPENEYSPSLLEDGSLLVVRWENDMSDGHLWLFSPEGRPLRRATGDVPRVGYYSVPEPGTFAIFVNDSVQSFVLSSRETGEIEKIGQDLGGSPPKAIPGERAVSFLRRGQGDEWWITRLDLDTREASPIVRALPGQNQYAWTPDGTLLMASGDAVHAFRPGRDHEWRRIAAFDDPGLQAITRIAVSPAGDRIALVSAAPEED